MSEKAVVKELGWVILPPMVSLEERIQRCGFNAPIHPNITAGKPLLGRGVRRRIVLYEWKGCFTVSQMQRLMRTCDDRPCDLDDGFGIAETFPQVQVANPLPLLSRLAVCLNDNRRKCAPVLDSSSAGRGISFHLLAGGWVDRPFCFPAVREEVYLDS